VVAAVAPEKVAVVPAFDTSKMAVLPATIENERFVEKEEPEVIRRAPPSMTKFAAELDDAPTAEVRPPFTKRLTESVPEESLVGPV
jgi:hypothetical protein